MEDRLSQKQLDDIFNQALAGVGAEEALSSLLTQEKEKEGHEAYDFNKPDKFNSNNLKSLQAIAENFAKNFSQAFSAQIRAAVDVRLPEDAERAVEQQPYGSEYVEKMTQGQSVFCVVDLGLNSGKGTPKVLLDMDLNWVIAIHQKLMGAPRIEVLDRPREMTEIEKISTLEWVDTMLLPQFKEAFRNIAPLNPKAERVEDEVLFAKATQSTDMIAMVHFEVKIGAKNSSMRFVIPYLAVKPFIEKLTAENLQDAFGAEDDEDQSGVFKSHLIDIQQRIDVELGKTKITLRELLEFSEDDVLVLDKRIDEHLTGYISDLPKFSCVQGKKDGRIAAKITGVATREGTLK